MGRAAYGIRIAALLLLLGTALACGRGGAGPTPFPGTTATPGPTPNATARSTPTPSPTPQAPAADQPPERDLIDLAQRFRGLPADTPRLARQSPYSYQVGDGEQFTIIDTDAPSTRTITTTLRLITEHAYLFVEDSLEVDYSTLETVGGDFETLVYPRVTAAFGKEWSPGVDADARISIVHAGLAGAGGYFSASDEYPQRVVARSNEREAVYLDASFLNSPGAVYNALLAHELQHLIHWNTDGGEESWVNEGLSQVAGELVGGGTATVGGFLAMPDTQLTDWPPDGAGVHYGESQLFFRYLLDRFGARENATALLAAPDDGIAGVNTYLQKLESSFEDVFSDWTVANYLDEASGPYAHQGADLTVAAVTTISGAGEGDDSVHQFGADYLEIEPPAGGAVFTFDGSDEVGIGIPAQDGAFWWSNTGDAIDSRLTREFDLTGLTSATLRFRVWFDIERGWDYAYVAASGDGGRTWEALPGRHTSDYDPVELAYGPGYTGDSGGDWLEEEVDLSAYAGGTVLLRFEYVTDDAAHTRGFAVDDIEVPELGFADGAETGGDWQAEGFRRIDGPSPQRFVLRLVERDEPSRVTSVWVDADNRATVLFGESPATIVISAVTEGTTEAATYSWSLQAP